MNKAKMKIFIMINFLNSINIKIIIKKIIHKIKNIKNNKFPQMKKLKTMFQKLVKLKLKLVILNKLR
jgi:hypothetical protein